MGRMGMIMRLAAAGLLTAFAAGHAAMADAAEDDDVSAIVTQHLRQALPEASPGGLAVAVRHAGRTSFFNFGLADAAAKRPVTSDSLFNLGSVGKVFDTALIADAARRQELSLDDPVAKYVAELQQGGDIRRVTLRQLASYTSGLVLPQDHPPWPEKSFTRPEFIAYLQAWRADQDHQPGQRMIYSHAGFVLLHLVLERRFGLPFGDLMRQRLLERLGLASTALPVPPTDEAHPRGALPAALLARAVQGYSDEGEPVGKPGNLQGYYHWLGAGQMYSSARDMAVFLAANLGDLPDQRPLQEAMVLAHQRVIAIDDHIDQALAWEVHRGAPTIVDKYGGLNNASAYIGLMPSRKLGIVLLGNRGSMGVADAGRAIMAALAEADGRGR